VRGDRCLWGGSCAYAASPRLPLRFYLEAGQFEDGRGAVNIFTTTRHMRDVLRAKGYPVRHAEFASGTITCSGGGRWRVG